MSASTNLLLVFFDTLLVKPLSWRTDIYQYPLWTSLFPSISKFKKDFLNFAGVVGGSWNRNYFLRFRFRFLLLKSYGSGSGSDFWKSYGSGSGSGSYFWKVTVPVPVPAPYLYHKKQIFLKQFVSLLHSKLFYKEKDYKYQQINCKMWKKKMLNEGTQIHNFISSSGSGSDFVTSYGSGSGSGYTRQKVTVPTVPVPVPQHCLEGCNSQQFRLMSHM